MANSILAHRWCVGIDLHKDTMTICTYCRCCGEISFRKIACKNRDQVAEFFRALPRPHAVAIEAVGFYRWLWELLEPLVEKLVLADATQARALAGRRLKTDREDAQNIAELLADGRLALGLCPAPGSASAARLDATTQPPVASARPRAARSEEHHEHQQPALAPRGFRPNA